jgi:chitinase
VKRIFLAYLAIWPEFEIATIPAEKLTHICYAFAQIEHGRVGLHAAAQDPQQLAQAELKFAQLAQLKQRNAELKILISIGGWGADGFSDAALTADSRRQFAESAVAFMLARQLDGIDLDWEYPSNAMAGIVAREVDRQNFSLLLAAVRQRLDAQSDQEGRVGAARYQLSIAAGAGQYYLDGVEINEVARCCDFINLMTYDFYNGWATRAGHHANLFTSPLDPDGDSAERSVQLFLNAGVPAKQLVLGCPLYGRSLRGVGASGLGEPGLAGSNAAPGFRLIATQMIGEPNMQRHWDDVAQAPWLFDGEHFISYEDAESIALKGRYACSENLGGVMFWELTEDHQFTLVDALHAAIS